MARTSMVPSGPSSMPSQNPPFPLRPLLCQTTHQLGDPRSFLAMVTSRCEHAHSAFTYRLV